VTFDDPEVRLVQPFVQIIPVQLIIQVLLFQSSLCREVNLDRAGLLG
jgi:hypothetical protein